ncbi:hypothetical protein L1887_32259 [Cichorium endivia]|nr:hypothetical protein L1887_32259 [Cichorium endivia]
MATEASSQTTEALSIPVLKNQSANLVLRTDPNLYPQPFVALVECLKVSVLGHALTNAPAIPAALVHRAHYTSNALFDTNNNVKSVFYEAIDSRGKTKKIQLTKEKFAEALHLPLYNSKEMVIPTAEQLVDMFNAMGVRDTVGDHQHLQEETAVRSLEVDFALILWADFCSHINHSLKGTEISNARFWAIVVDAQYKQIGFVYDPNFPEMRYTHITVPPLDEVPADFCAQIPQEMLVKVSMDCDEVNTYRNTLHVPYLVREIIPTAPTKAPAQTKGKKKLAGGPSGPKRVTKKRKPSQQTTPKRKQSKRAKKEEHQSSPIHETRPPTPPSTTIPPPPPPTTAPPTTTITFEQTTTIQTTTSDVPPTTAPQTSTIYTTLTLPTSTTQITESITSLIENPIISAAQTSELIITSSEPLLNISTSEVDKLLPDFPFGDDFDFETTTFSKPPSKEETVAAFHMTPLTIEEDEDD